MKQIDLFRPFMSPHVLKKLAPILSYDTDTGRMYIGEGKKVFELEQAFQAWLQSERKLLALNSGTSALELAGMLVDLQEGDEVISSPISCFATYSPVLLAKAKIVWADVDPKTGLIDLDDVVSKITHKTKAILTISWGGKRIDHRFLKSQTTIPIIFDDAHGSYYSDPYADFIAYSTQAIKFLTTIDGGFLSLSDAVYDKGRLLRWYGLDRVHSTGFRCGEQNITLPGRKMHMNDVNAAIGLENLHYLTDTIDAQKNNAYYYAKHIVNPLLTTPTYEGTCSYWLYTLFAENRDALKAYLAKKGIESSLVHARNDTHAIFSYAQTDLPGVTQFNNTQLSIPIGWWLTTDERDFIVHTLNNWKGTRDE